MSPDDAFLQAILEQPDDDTPRLMYADWLAERAEPRGEFIHLQLRIGDMGVAALAASPAVRGLTTLHLYTNRITDRGAAALAASPHLAGLKMLTVEYNPIGERGREALERRFGDRVQVRQAP